MFCPVHTPPFSGPYYPQEVHIAMAEPNKLGANGSGETTGLKQVNKLMIGKGFYIVLFLCLVAMGISGYVIYKLGASPIDPNLPSFTDVGLFTTASTDPSMTDLPPSQTTGSSTSSSTSETTSQTKPPQTTPSKVFYVRPTGGEVLHPYSDTTPVYNPTMGDWRVHTGIDIAADLGTTVCAVAPGKVTAVYKDYFRGNVVEITHPDGNISIYCGLADDPDVTKGLTVTARTVIGRVGETAAFEVLDEPHLHFEMKSADGNFVDPELLLPVK